MYNNKLIACIKVNGQILRENEGIVNLPFGCEYSIFVKNLESVRAQISVSVDGVDATDGTRLIIGPNSQVELERFIRNGNLSEGNRFKFIERSAAVEAHRGIGSDDGIVRLEGWKERVPQFINAPITRYYRPPHWPPPGPARPMARGRSIVSRPAGASMGERRMDSVNYTSKSVNTAGITVAGSASNQQFYSTSGFALEPASTVIVLRLIGQIGGQFVEEPMTVAYKPQCATCGRTNKANSQFCSQCGTALVLI